MRGPARDRPGRAPHPPHRGGVGDRASFAALPSPRQIRSEAVDKPGVSPRLYGIVQGASRENAARILIETERLLRIYGHRKVTVADIADACGFSAANVYRYFSSRRVMLDTLASHYLHEIERAALLARSATALRRATGSVVSSPA